MGGMGYAIKPQRIVLRPSEIFFSQKSIPNRFEDGQLIGERLDELIRNELKIGDIRIIRVKNIHDRWYTLDNRRLWVFRNYEKIRLRSYLGTTISVLVKDDFESQEQLLFAANHTGEDVQIENKHDPGGEGWKLVDSINSSTYGHPKLLLLKDIGDFSWRISWGGTKAVVSILWSGITGAYRLFTGKEDPDNDTDDLDEIKTTV